MDFEILKNIESPEDIKELSKTQIKILCEELRTCIINTVSKNGGHLASNLGVVELTVALHRVFSSPVDSIIFDVGHQSYTHKLLTGRFHLFSTIRTKGGISGFMRPDESIHDPFVTGHSSNSISAAYGIFMSKKLCGERGTAIAVIGDGAMTGGMAYEALNNAGNCQGNFIVVLNDNKMSISKNVGSISKIFSKLRNRPYYHNFKFALNHILDKIPVIGPPIYNFLLHFKEYIKKIVYHNNIFVGMGFNYLGPVDGHNVDAMENIFKIANSYNKPTLIHVVTTKGKGYAYAECSPKDYHGVSPFDIGKGAYSSDSLSYSDIVGNTLCELAESNPEICAVTAAMTVGTGLSQFSSRFPERFFDVGIAEQHAITFCAGLAKGGSKPYFAVYSSFLQRGYDQIIHDAAIAGLPIKLLVDRAGIVGEDGESHQGVFDVAFLTTVPGITIYSPCFYNELSKCIKESVNNDGICVIRYPRGCENNNYSSEITGDFLSIENGADKVLVTYGRLFSNAIDALHNKGKADIIKLNKIFPVQNELIEKLLSYSEIHFFEEGIKKGGIAEHIGSLLIEAGYNGKYIIHAIEDGFVPAARVSSALKDCGLDAESMAAAFGIKL